MPQMHFGSLDELWHMAGHGAYVWSAYAIVLVVVVSLTIDSRARSGRVLGRVRQRIDSAQKPETPEI